MDESTKNYRTDELDELMSYGPPTESYRVKVIGGFNSETKWLSITDEELRDIRGILTGNAVNTALHILNREGYAVRTYGVEDVHNVLDEYMHGNTSGVIDTAKYRDEITRHVMEGDDWEGVLDSGDATSYIWSVIEGTHNDHPEWFPKVEEANPLSDVSTPDLVERYARCRTIVACTRGPFPADTAKELETIREELRKRGIIE